MDHLLLPGVPAFERPHAHRAEDPQVVVAVTGGQLLVRRIPHRLGQLELRTFLAVGVDGLLVIEVDAVGGVLRFESRTVVVELVIHIVLRRGERIRRPQALIRIFQPHLGMHAAFEHPLVGRRGVDDPEIPRSGDVGDEDQLAQPFVQLGGDLPRAFERHDGASGPPGHIPDHDRAFGPRTRDRHAVTAFQGPGAQGAEGAESQ